MKVRSGSRRVLEGRRIALRAGRGGGGTAFPRTRGRIEAAQTTPAGRRLPGGGRDERQQEQEDGDPRLAGTIKQTTIFHFHCREKQNPNIAPITLTSGLELCPVF